MSHIYVYVYNNGQYTIVAFAQAVWLEFFNFLMSTNQETHINMK